MKKIAFILALFMMLGVLATFTSCGGDNNKETQATAETKEQETQETELEKLEVKDLKNQEFKILWPDIHVDGHFLHNEIDSDGSNQSNVIDFAVYNRTQMVEDAYNVDIIAETMFCSTIGKTMQNNYLTGDTPYQAAATNIKFLLNAAVEGALADFNTMRYYKEQSWWDNATMEDYSLGGARYFGMGDIIYSDNFYPYCVFTNLQFADDYGIEEDFYDLALNYEWTYEKMLDLAKDVSQPGIDEKWDYSATYGVLLNANTARAIYYGFGKNVVAHDEEDVYVWEMLPVTTEPIVSKLNRLFHSEDQRGYATDDDIGHNEPGLTHAQTALKMFMNGQALFYTEELIVSERLNNANSSLNFAILPMPLEDENQSRYYCVLNDAVVISVPTLGNQEVASLVLSAMGRASVDTLTPAFFDNVLTYRYMTNQKSVQTLQLILNSAKALDIGSLLNWGEIMTGFKNIVLTGDGSFATTYAENIDTAESEMAKFIRKVLFYQGK